MRGAPASATGRCYVERSITRKLQYWDINCFYGARMCLHLANANLMGTEVTEGKKDKLIRTILNTKHDRKPGYMN